MKTLVYQLRYFGLFILVVATSSLWAQPIPENMNVNSTLNAFSTPGNHGATINNTQLIGRTMPQQETEGTTYYTEDWTKANISLENGQKIEDALVIYDIDKNIFYLRVSDEEIRALKGNLVTEFRWYNMEIQSNEYFVSKKKYQPNADVLVDFLKVMQSDQVSLLMGRNNRLKKADYKEGIGTGRPYDTILKEDRYYLAIGDQLYGFTGKIKEDQQTLNSMPDRIPKINLKSFEKSNKIKIKTESGMRALVAELNNQISGS